MSGEFDEDVAPPTLVGVLRDGGWTFVVLGFFARLGPDGAAGWSGRRRWRPGRH